MDPLRDQGGDGFFNGDLVRATVQHPSRGVLQVLQAWTAWVLRGVAPLLQKAFLLLRDRCGLLRNTVATLLRAHALQQ